MLRYDILFFVPEEVFRGVVCLVFTFLTIMISSSGGLNDEANIFHVCRILIRKRKTISLSPKKLKLSNLVVAPFVTVGRFYMDNLKISVLHLLQNLR